MFVDRFRHISLRTRLALGTLLPLGLATAGVAVAWVPAAASAAHATHFTLLLSAALLGLAIGTGLLLLQTNIRSLERPLEDASRLTRALMHGQYGVRVRVHRLDETGQLLVALGQLADYLAVVLPEPGDEVPGGTQHTITTADSLERIAAQLREHEDVFATPTEATPSKDSPALAPAHLRLVTVQA
ncbi:hypothetical protein [uncultured Sphaerotilus sp.]|uniref:hypothetical protein n=1 Tax=uncultured Sphaerotilus sp. TaxID=474984 RepID=UPI0030CA4132